VTVRRRHLHQVARQLPDFSVAHLEDVAVREVYVIAVISLSSHSPFGNDDVVLLDFAVDCNERSTHEARVLDLPLERFLSVMVIESGKNPFDIVRKAGEDFRMIVPAEGVHVLLDGCLVS